MNDLQTLHDAWIAPEPPSDAEHAHARAALLGHARDAEHAHARAALPEHAGDVRRRRRPTRGRSRRLRLVAIATVAAIFAAGLAAVQNLNDSGGGLSGLAVADALERAAVAAETRPFTPPRDDQWIYIEDRLTRSDDDGSEPARGLVRSADGRSLISRGWRRADGGATAWIDGGGELHVDSLEPRGKRGRPLEVAVGPLAGYKTLAALPTDPDELLRWAYRQAEDVTGAGLSEHGDVYAIFAGMLRENLLPPELEAAIFRALKQVRGVSVETVEVLDRPALAVAQTEDWLREELLLDPRTYRYRGERSTITKDASIDPAKAGNADGRVHAGSWVIGERVRTAIVDEPGRRP